MAKFSSDFSNDPPLYSVKPRFLFPNFLKRAPVPVAVGLALGAIVAASVRAKEPWLWGLLMLAGGMVVFLVAWGLAQLRLNDSWYAIRADGVHIRWGGLMRSGEVRPFKGIGEVDFVQTAAEKRADLGSVRFHTVDAAGAKRVQHVLHNVPDPASFVAFVKPVVERAQQPQRQLERRLF